MAYLTPCMQLTSLPQVTPSLHLNLLYIAVHSSVFSSVVCTLYTLQYEATPLMYAAERGRTEVVQVLLSQQEVESTVVNMRDKVR